MFTHLHEQIEQSDDLLITQIQTVYRIRTATWALPRPIARHTNGLVFFLEGRIRYNFNGSFVSAGAGDVLTLPRDIVYNGVKETAQQSYFVVDFETDASTPFDHFALPRVFCPQSFDRTKQLFQALLDAWKDPFPHSKLLCRARLYELLYELLREHRSKLPSLPGVLAHVTAEIRRLFTDPSLSVSALAAQVGLSEAHLRRLFHRYLHLSPQDYIQQTRLAYAQELLLNGILVQDVAAQCGYSSPFYFSRTFKQKLGYTPSEFKGMH